MDEQKPQPPQQPSQSPLQQERRYRRRPLTFKEVIQSKGWKIYGISFISGFSAFALVELYQQFNYKRNDCKLKFDKCSYEFNFDKTKFLGEINTCKQDITYCKYLDRYFGENAMLKKVERCLNNYPECKFRKLYKKAKNYDVNPFLN